jgi:hypothetical protein
MDLSGAKRSKNVSKKHTKNTTEGKNTEAAVVNHQININISMPSTQGLKKLFYRTKKVLSRLWQSVAQKIQNKLPSKKVINVGLVLIIIFSSALLVRSLIINSHSNSNSDEVKGIESKKKEKPDFAIFYPDSAKIKEMSYDGNKKVASYPDQIETTPITVSQQKLPQTFKANPVVELEKLAKQINANTKLETTAVNAFMGQSVKGPQTVVLVKNDTLIFIKSDKQVSISDWNKYLDSLILQK